MAANARSREQRNHEEGRLFQGRASRRRASRLQFEALEERIALTASPLSSVQSLAPAVVSGTQAGTVADNVRWLNDLAKLVLHTTLPQQIVTRTATQIANGLSPRTAIFKLLQTPEGRVATSQLAYQFLLNRTENPSAPYVHPSGFIKRGDLAPALIQIAASQEYFARANRNPLAYRKLIARDLLSAASLPASLQNRPVDTVAQRLALLNALVKTPQFQRTWTERLSGIALTQGQFSDQTLKVANREIAGPQGFRLVLARFLSSTESRQDVERRSALGVSASVNVGDPVDQYYLTNRQALVPDPVTDPAAYNEPLAVSGTGIPSASPWGNGVVLPQVPYNAIMTGTAVQPQLTLPYSLVSSLTSGVTFQTWFQAKSPGALLSENVAVNGTAMQAPLIYINSSGNLVAGLFDTTQLPVQNNMTVLSWQAANGLQGGESKSGYAQVGAANPIVSQMSVVDNTWHHVAFVVTGTSESLYLDGMLEGVINLSSGSYSFTPTIANGGSANAPTAFTLGGTTFPEKQSTPYPQINYPQGFIGTIDEVASWTTALTQSQVQQAMTSPVSADDLKTDLLQYFNFDAASNTSWANQVPGGGGAVAPVAGTTVVQVPTTIPTDPFTDVERLAGGRTWGLDIMTPLASPQVTVNEGAPVVRKVGLDAGDQLEIQVPDESLGQLQVDVVTDLGTTSSVTIKGGESTFVRATRTGTYKITLTWMPPNGGGVAVSFSLAPGSLNSLAELLTSYNHTGPDNVVYQWAYSDPSIPGVNNTAGNSSGDSAAASYFPLWTDQNYFPTPLATTSANWASQLSAAYSTLVSNSSTLSGGFANLINSAVTLPTGAGSVQSDLDDAYVKAYHVSPPTPPNGNNMFPVQPASSPQNAVYEFFYNANIMRQTAYSVLTGSGSPTNPTTLASWVNDFLATVSSTAGVPANIAATIANGQAEQVQNVTVSFPTNAAPSAGQVIGEAAVWALGGALGAVFGLPAVGAPILGAILGGAGASIAGSFIGEAGVPSSVSLTVPLGTVTTSIVNATHLDDLSTNITAAVTNQWKNFYAALTSTTFIQAVLSNYGLVKALQDMDGAVLSKSELSPSDAATNILSRASWHTMVPAVFHWVPTDPTTFPTGNGQTTNLTGNNISLNGPDGPQGIAVGDFNNDHKLDMVVSDYSTDELSVLLGNGDGTFQTAKTVSLNGGDGPEGIVTGDFNGDGRLDLAVADYSTDDLSILLGNGDGTFAKAQKVSLKGPDGPKGIAIGDFNNDHILDLAVTDYSSDELSVLLGNGDGTFQDAKTVSLKGGDGAEGIAIGDFNKDGNQDIAVSNYSTDDLSLLLGNGDGTFQAAQKISLGGPDGPQGLVATDLNGDGNLDLAVADNTDSSSEISILLGNGNGTFKSPTTVSTGDFNYQPSALIAVPVNNSPYPSLVFAYDQTIDTKHSSNTYSGIGVLFSNGPGTYNAPVHFQSNGTSIFAGLAAGDFNGDGFNDYVVANDTTDDLTIFSGNTVGNFATFLPQMNTEGPLVTQLGQLQALQGSHAVNVGPYDQTNLITPATNYFPPYLGDVSLPYAPDSGALNINSPGYFLSLTPVMLQESTYGYNYSQSGSMISGWNLVDANKNPIALSTLSQLFGAPATPGVSTPNAINGVNLSPIDPQQPYVGLNGGWYYAAKPAVNPTTGASAPATWADAFFNWGFGQQGYSPGNLVPYFEPTSGNGVFNGTLSGGSTEFPNPFNYTITYTPQTSAPPLVGTSVNLQASFNRLGIIADLSSFTNNPGIDRAGSAFSASSLGSPISWAGLLFYPGSLGANNAVAASGQTINLPAGSFSNLSFVGNAVNGEQVNQNFVVNYTDGTSQTFTQTLSDWGVSNSNSGESVAVKTNYRDNTNGSAQTGPYYLYGYQFALNKTKVVKSVTLPNNNNVILLGMTLS